MSSSHSAFFCFLFEYVCSQVTNKLQVLSRAFGASLYFWEYLSLKRLLAGNWDSYTTIWWGAQTSQQNLHYLFFTSFADGSISSFHSQALCQKNGLPISLARELSYQALNFLSEAPSECGCCWLPLGIRNMLQDLMSCFWLAASQELKRWLMFLQNTSKALHDVQIYWSDWSH